MHSLFLKKNRYNLKNKIAQAIIIKEIPSFFYKNSLYNFTLRITMLNYITIFGKVIHLRNKKTYINKAITIWGRIAKEQIIFIIPLQLPNLNYNNSLKKQNKF